MAVICPTVTAKDSHTFRTQVERVAKFASRIHLDLADGEFANKLVDLTNIWLPGNVLCDIHIMYQKPEDHIDYLISLNPNMVIVHAEADGNFPEIAEKLQNAGIKAGVALLQDTPINIIEPSIAHIDHVLVFSGNLGHFGGKADFDLLAKVEGLKRLKDDLEIGWDGGINDENVKRLVKSGVDVLNVGGFIQRAHAPEKAYAKLNSLI